MSALIRWAARYGIAKMMYRSPWWVVVLVLFFFVVAERADARGPFGDCDPWGEACPDCAAKVARDYSNPPYEYLRTTPMHNSYSRRFEENYRCEMTFNGNEGAWWAWCSRTCYAGDCPDGTYHDDETGQCKETPECQDGYAWDLGLQKCTPICDCVDCVYDEETGICDYPECPQGQHRLPPDWVCVDQCEHIDQYYSDSLGKCVWKKCADHQVRNVHTGECEDICDWGVYDYDTGMCRHDLCGEGKDYGDPDGDGHKECVDKDSDGDGTDDAVDDCPDDPTGSHDADGDGKCENEDNDRDGDGRKDWADSHPDDPTEWQDSDGDGIGDNADTDDNNDGVLDDHEDPDGDGIANDDDPDDDNDGIPDESDDDDDNNGIPDDQEDIDGDGVKNEDDYDDDGDGIPDHLDDDDDGDGTPDRGEDSDGDGIPNEDDPDDDNDGILDKDDSDDDGDGIPDTKEGDGEQDSADEGDSLDAKQLGELKRIRKGVEDLTSGETGAGEFPSLGEWLDDEERSVRGMLNSFVDGLASSEVGKAMDGLRFSNVGGSCPSYSWSASIMGHGIDVGFDPCVFFDVIAPYLEIAMTLFWGVVSVRAFMEA